MKIDLNKLVEENYSIKTKEIEVYFTNLDKNIIRLIKQSDVVLGCVAWLTNFDILRELGNNKIASIIVQKEDFLRPDLYFIYVDNWIN